MLTVLTQNPTPYVPTVLRQTPLRAAIAEVGPIGGTKGTTTLP